MASWSPPAEQTLEAERLTEADRLLSWSRDGIPAGYTQAEWSRLMGWDADGEEL